MSDEALTTEELARIRETFERVPYARLLGMEFVSAARGAATCVIALSLPLDCWPPSLWVCPQAESLRVFSMSFLDHSVHGFCFCATTALRSITTTKHADTTLIMGLLDTLTD